MYTYNCKMRIAAAVLPDILAVGVDGPTTGELDVVGFLDQDPRAVGKGAGVGDCG